MTQLRKKSKKKCEWMKMTKKELLDMLTNIAIEYRKESYDSVFNRNTHMNNLGSIAKVISIDAQDIIDAVVVDFINYVGSYQGLDWGLYTKDLVDGKKELRVEDE